MKDKNNQFTLDFRPKSEEPSYFNTTGESGEDLAQYKDTASGQDLEVLEVFKRHSQSSFTTYMVWDLLGQKMLKSSVGRSINTLERKGLLVKTGEKKVERYGRSNYLYTLRQ